MDKCLNCGGELEHIEGRKKKKYCDEFCKGEHWAKTHKSEPKYVQFKTFKELSDKFNAVTKGKYDNPEIPITNSEPPNFSKKIDVYYEVGLPPYKIEPTEPEIDVKGITDRIAVLRKELLKPSSSLIPLRVYKKVREDEIAKLEAQLKHE